MFTGKLEAIFFASSSDDAMTGAASVNVVAGQGVADDRYSVGEGTFSKQSPDRQITLIEAEAIEAASREYGFELAADETRRNLVTRDVPLNHLVDKEFLVGSVRIRGIRLCEPCAHLEQRTGKKVLRALTHRGGLRAEVLSDGQIQVGDEIRIA